MPNKIYDDALDYAKVAITQTGKGYVATLYLNKKVFYRTTPMLARENAVMLVNRKIKRFNFGKRSIDQVPLYKDKG